MKNIWFFFLIIFFSGSKQCHAQDSAKITFKDAMIAINHKAGFSVLNISDTTLLIYKIDSVNYFCAELVNREMVNFGNLEYYRIGERNYLMRTGIWKDTPCGNYGKMSNAGYNSILDEYCITNEVESVKKKKNRRKRIKQTRFSEL
jgi:hypothetical protein